LTDPEKLNESKGTTPDLEENLQELNKRFKETLALTQLLREAFLQSIKAEESK